jgi:hypothetical protein
MVSMNRRAFMITTAAAAGGLAVASTVSPADAAGLGSPGHRPAIRKKPTSSTTGPRHKTTRTLTAAQALAAVLKAPKEANGRRYLRRAKITGTLTLDLSKHTDITFEDCVIDARWASYGVRGWYGGGSKPSHSYPAFSHCEIKNASSATIIGQYMRFLKCDVHHGVDIVKIFGPLEIWGSYLHSNWHESDSHCDTVQIVTGGAGALIHHSNLSGFCASDSPTNAGKPTSGVLQTGKVTGPIGRVDWLHNWFDGGGYTIRAGKASDNPSNHAIKYRFKGNRFGRKFTWGPLYGNIPTSKGNCAVSFDSSNVWENTGKPVHGS